MASTSTSSTASTRSHSLRIAPERLHATIAQFATFGATPAGGLNRLSLSDADQQARDALGAIAAQQGYDLGIDPIGNMFVTRPGRDPHAPAVLIGSHLDSQPYGGRHDGTYGVLAGLEVLRALDDTGLETLRSITLVNWTDEEGARFSPSLLGSSVFAGRVPLAEALAQQDAKGAVLGRELERIGYAGSYDTSGLRIHRAFEAHIEQGPLLEQGRIDIGVVTGIQALRWYDIDVQGQASHAGTTPRSGRSDALVAAARLIAEIDRAGSGISDSLRTTVGELRVTPNSRNVIPGRVRCYTDFRHPDDAVLDAAERSLREAAARIEGDSGTSIAIDSALRMPAVTFDPSAVELVRSSAGRLGLSHVDIASGAGHDSMNIASLAPTAMVFIPCVGGISHTESEGILDEWAVNGARVLLDVVSRAADEPER